MRLAAYKDTKSKHTARGRHCSPRGYPPRSMKRARSTTTAQHAPSPLTARHGRELASSGRVQTARTIAHWMKEYAKHASNPPSTIVAIVFVRSRNIGARRAGPAAGIRRLHGGGPHGYRSSYPPRGPDSA